MKIKFNKIKYHVIIIISIIMVNISLLNINSWINDKEKVRGLEKLLRKEVSEKVSKEENVLINPPKNKDDYYWKHINESFLQIDFNNLEKQNKNTVAWIKVNGTNVDYPVVQTNNNEYYLTHSYDNTYNKAGWIFSDFRNNLNSLNKNTIIYGHGRIDDTMFGSLRFTLEDNWYQNIDNHIIKLSTKENNMIFQIFSIYYIFKENYYITTHFNSIKEYEVFLNTIKNRSIFDFKTIVDSNDKILTLSTCKNNYGKRLVVHAKLIKKEIIK